MTKVFVDSSVLFSACYSSTGASREIIRKAISREIKLVISKHIIEEVERNLEKDAPYVIPTFQQFLSLVPFKVVRPTKQEVEKATNCVALKDAPILAAARQAKADYLVSLDTHHLVGVPKVVDCAEVEIVLPGEFLKRIEKLENVLTELIFQFPE